MSQSEQQHKALVTEVFMVSLAGGAAGDYSTAALDIRGRSCTEDKGTKISSIGERVCLCVCVCCLGDLQVSVKQVGGREAFAVCCSQTAHGLCSHLLCAAFGGTTPTMHCSQSIVLTGGGVCVGASGS